VLYQCCKTLRTPPDLFLRAAAKAVATTLALGFATAPLRAADVSHYSVGKGVLFAQNNAGLPQIRSGLPFLFQAAVVPVSNGLLSATVQLPFGTFPMGPRFLGAPSTFTDRQPTQESLDLFYPGGNYTIHMTNAHDGTRSGTLALSGDDYPNAPSVVNYSQAQAINPSNDFTLRWSAFLGGTTSDFIFAQLDAATGLVFRTSYTPGAVGALNGTNTSVLIPSNTLAPGRAYSGRIAFVKTVANNTTAYPGVTGAATYFTQTDFFIATTGAGDIAPPLVTTASPPNGATNVSRTAPFVLTFNEPMRTAHSFFISGTAAGRTFNWNPDGLTLVVTPTSNWPPNTAIAWVLNPSDGPQFFGDLNRSPLAMETAFRFTTGTNFVPPAAPMLTDARRLVTGRFQFKLLGESNRIYAAEASTNFTDWVSLGTNIAFGGSIQYQDNNSLTLPHRFYRGFAP